MMTGNGATTLTPENSEAPRESLAGAWLDEAVDLKPEHIDLVLGRSKVSSPELASLAAKYLDFDAGQLELYNAKIGEHAQFVKDVRALAASVLAQAEGTPRK